MSRRRITLLLAVVLLLNLAPASAPAPAEAIDISVVYDPTVSDAVDPCADPEYFSCPDGVARTDEMVLLVEVAAAYWASIFHDSHLYDIRVAWKVGGMPSAETTHIDAAGHPDSAIVRVPADLSLWYDPTPFDDEEFAMEPKLYRDTHPAEQSEAFGGAPPEILEVGYNGPGPGMDLLTILMHELGHAMGLNANVAASQRAPACDEEDDPYYHLDPALLGGAEMSLKAYEYYGDFPVKGNSADGGPGARDRIDQQSYFDCSHLALGGIKACDDDPLCESHQALMWYGMLPSARSRPSIADILAVATAAGWQEIYLPRQYSLATGSWTDPATWLGTRVPNAGNNVYVVNRDEQVEIDLYELGQADDVLISDGNTLNVVFGTLSADRVTLEGDGTTLLADSGATLDLVYLTTGDGGLLDLANDATVDVFWTLRNDGTLRGGDSLVQTHELDNRGVIRANGGVLTVQADTLDLDGSDEFALGRSLEALAGDLVFDGVVSDEVAAGVTVGAGQEITFTHGWQQAYTGNPIMALRLEGMTADATVNGSSRLNGITIVDGRGRFTSVLTLGLYTHVQMDIDGSTPVADYDQVAVEQRAFLDGTLDLRVDDAPPPDPGDDFGLVALPFVPAPNQEFVIMTYASHSGEFAAITGWDLGAIRLYPEYGPTELRIVARLVGDANGDGALTNQDKSALVQSYGPCTPDPVPCVNDIDADGDVDKDDLDLLKDLLK